MRTLRGRHLAACARSRGRGCQAQAGWPGFRFSPFRIGFMGSTGATDGSRAPQRVINTKKKFTDIIVARALHPHQSLPDPSSPPLLSLTPNPSPYQPFRGGVLGRDASDITFLTCVPTLTG
eukprot:scaffold5747_cov128-Isochrysis_galbana.AAC.6